MPPLPPISPPRSPRARRPLWAAFLAVPVLSCGGGGSGTTTPTAAPPAISIDAPALGFEGPAGPVVVSLTYGGDDLELGSLLLLFDGVDVTADLTMTASAATGTLDCADLGLHTLVASIQNTNGDTADATRDFELVDGDAPPPSTLVYDGVGENSQYGFAVDGIDDVDGDGLADLIVGAPNTEVGGVAFSGRVRVLSGADGAVILELDGAPGEQLGASVAAAGLVDGDLVPDLIAGAPDADVTGVDAGAAYVFSGADGTLIHSFFGLFEGDAFGISVDGAGLVDLDGRADLIVGANTAEPNGPKSGQVRVFSGLDGSELHVFDGAEETDQLGIDVAGVGDLDQDGHDDFAAGAWGEDGLNGDQPSAGAVRVWSGKTGALLWHFHGLSTNDHLGVSVDGAGDVDGDGWPDVIAGQDHSEFVGYDSGAAWVYSGRTGFILQGFTGDSEDDLFGVEVTGLGDVDGDGFADVAVGALGDVGPNGELGAAYVYSGQCGARLFTIRGSPVDPAIGLALSDAGDTDGDGVPELLLGSPFGGLLGDLAGRVLVFDCSL